MGASQGLIQAGLERFGTLVAQRTVQTFAIVEHLDVLKIDCRALSPGRGSVDDSPARS